MSSQKDIFISDIDQALDSMPEEFTIDELKKKLGNRSDGLARRLERLLDGDDRFFCSAPNGVYCRREAFFRNFKFAVTFDSWELSQGFLIPGHRFSAFLHSDVFPSEVVLLSDGKKIPQREITMPLGQAFHYHMLLGSDNVFDFLLAESPANAGIRSSCGSNEQVTLSVYDLETFYRENNAVEGDAVICEVKDYTKGILEISFVRGSDRSTAARKTWVSAFDKALEKVCERFEDYLDITEQLAWGLFYGAKELSSSPSASMDEYIRLSRKMSIRADGDHAVLAVRSETDSAGNVSDPSDVFSLSHGETGSLAGILKELGNPVTMPEIDAYILDECFARESDFDAICRRIFGSLENIGVDETQRVCLLNYLEERFEELHENYNRADDELKAPLRADILEAVDAKLEFFRMLSDTDADPDMLDKEAMHQLADVDLKLDEMLKLLNSEKYTPDEVELEKIAELVESRLDEQQDLLEKLSEKIKTHW